MFGAVSQKENLEEKEEGKEMFNIKKEYQTLNVKIQELPNDDTVEQKM